MQDETLSSFIIRYLVTSGSFNIDKLENLLFTNCNDEWNIFPSPKKEIREIYFQAFEQSDVEQIIKNNTILSIYKPVANLVFEAQIKRLFSLKNSLNINKIRYNCLHKNEKIKIDIKFCVDCFIDQIRTYGFTWFKRDWLLPGSSYCLTHLSKLTTRRCNCENKKSILHSINLLQGYCSACETDLWSHTTHKEVDNYSAWLKKLMLHGLPHFSNNLRRFLIIEAAVKLGAKKPLFPYISTIETAKDLNQILSNNGVIDSAFGEDKLFNRFNVISNSIAYKKSTIEPIPTFCLFYPLSLAYPNFDNFLYHLKSICLTDYQDNFYGEKTKFYDCKDKNMLWP